MPWQADMFLLDTSGVDWNVFRDMATLYAPVALERTRQPALAPWRRKFREAHGKYRQVAYAKQQTPSWSGFLQYLREPWQVSSVWLLPFAGIRRVLHHGRSLLR